MFFYQEKNMYRIFPTGACSLYIVVIYSLYNLLREPWNLSFQRVYRLHTAILDRPPSSAATMEVQGPDTQ